MIFILRTGKTASRRKQKREESSFMVEKKASIHPSTSPRTILAIAGAAVRPGDSIPIRLMKHRQVFIFLLPNYKIPECSVFCFQLRPYSGHIRRRVYARPADSAAASPTTPAPIMRTSTLSIVNKLPVPELEHEERPHPVAVINSFLHVLGCYFS